ncbi:hypothetical protein EXIGLDRAFT_773788 [Exidia glandulosa HHB12029]|uniref:Uncharacterized protein n=1 Tax=Exidia glandulosa HHB12029 TaxID=1314781 RepID=A0A165EN68_EXIGL|nr:hypothetical protein EXIGLDRAFT_773788 [Exidia glandulosa HHB12029]
MAALLSFFDAANTLPDRFQWIDMDDTPQETYYSSSRRICHLTDKKRRIGDLTLHSISYHAFRVLQQHSTDKYMLELSYKLAQWGLRYKRLGDGGGRTKSLVDANDTKAQIRLRRPS